MAAERPSLQKRLLEEAEKEPLHAKKLKVSSIEEVVTPLWK